MTQEAGQTAYFVVDAFRFEMGDESIGSSLRRLRPRRNLKVRLAELPTVTEVGMMFSRQLL